MIQLFTSIRPPADAEGISYLRDCLNSWRAAGFGPVAVNGPVEVEALRQLGLPVEFAVMAADGKPRIGAFLSAIRQRSCRFAGIINSDCRMMGYPGLAARLRDQLEGRAVLAWRLDVGDLKPSGARYGFDAFVFDTEVMPADDAGFSIGDVWWDYWFPLACEMRGAKIETLAFPLLKHKVHPLNWKARKWDDGAHRLWAALRAWRASAPGTRSVFREIPDTWWRSERLTAHQVAVVSQGKAADDRGHARRHGRIGIDARSLRPSSARVLGVRGPEKHAPALGPALADGGSGVPPRTAGRPYSAVERWSSPRSGLSEGAIRGRHAQYRS
jgi:hypothetical protein